MKYKYILLDVDNTLFDFDACEELAFYRCMQALGVCATKECFQRYCVINKECWHALELGQMTKEELQNARFSRLATEFSLPIDPDAANDLYLTHLGQTDVLIEGAIEFVSALADHAKLYVITNGLARFVGAL